MYDSILSEFLRTFDKIKPNPFLNKNFFVAAVEINEFLEEYSVMSAIISFKNLTCKIESNKNNLLAAYIAILVKESEFGYDPSSKFYLNGVEFIGTNYLNIVERFKDIGDIASIDVFEIKYSNTEYGVDAYNYNRSLL
jgi:hypothetical protein